MGRVICTAVCSVTGCVFNVSHIDMEPQGPCTLPASEAMRMLTTVLAVVSAPSALSARP